MIPTYVSNGYPQIIKQVLLNISFLTTKVIVLLRYCYISAKLCTIITFKTVTNPYVVFKNIDNI